MDFILASQNNHKIEEIKNIALEHKFGGNIVCFPDVDIPDIEENGRSFYDNAIIKAEFLYNIYKKPIISDDSGLCVKRLGGFPGIYSSRYSGGGSENNINKLLLELQGAQKKDRKAYFICVVCLYLCPEEIFLFSGKAHGEILSKRAGINGFGYDPVFFLPELNKTMAEITSDEKNRISHRGLAFAKLFDFLKKSETF